MKFPEKWISLIYQCISTVQYKIQVNGRLSQSFNPSRGIRQGDPLSPYLFILASNVLSSLVTHLERTGHWNGIKICKKAPAISHLFYADDSLFFFEANQENVSSVKFGIDKFCHWSGQEINFSKSSIIFSPNVANRQKTMLSQILGVKFSSRLGKYLGAWIDPGRNKSNLYSHALGQIERRTALWQTKLLSQASRLQLIKSVLSSAEIHIMSSIALPQKICDGINSRCINFFWWQSDTSKRMHLVNKETLFSPMEEGGLGIRSASWTNKALLAKQLWRIIAFEDSFFGQVMQSKYIDFSEQTFLRTPYNSS